MSGSGGNRDEMKRYSNMDEARVERLLSGDAAQDDPRDADVASFLADLSEAFSANPSESLEATHLAAMIEAASISTDKGDSTVTSGSNAYGPAWQAAGLPKWRRLIMWFNNVWATRSTKVASGIVAALLAFSGLAYAGVLPTPVQDVVSNALEPVGITVPHSDAAEQIEAPDADEAAEPAESTDEESATAGVEDQGEDADEQGEDAADQGDDADEADEQDSDDEDRPAASQGTSHDSGADESDEPDDSTDESDAGHDSED